MLLGRPDPDDRGPVDTGEDCERHSVDGCCRAGRTGDVHVKSCGSVAEAVMRPIVQPPPPQETRPENRGPVTRICPPVMEATVSGPNPNVDGTGIDTDSVTRISQLPIAHARVSSPLAATGSDVAGVVVVVGAAVALLDGVMSVRA